MTRRFILALALAAGALLTPWAARSDAAQGTVCTQGQTRGAWDLPASIGGAGVADGDLFLGTTIQVVYHFTATLTESPSPCLSCREGRIDGYLDDGVGPGPDFAVQGRWIGSFFSGQGTWFAVAFRIPSPGTLVPAGRMAGTYSDPPITPTSVGTYDGRWKVCN